MKNKNIKEMPSYCSNLERMRHLICVLHIDQVIIYLRVVHYCQPGRGSKYHIMVYMCLEALVVDNDIKHWPHLTLSVPWLPYGTTL